jgi:hypothetical protein
MRHLTQLLHLPQIKTKDIKSINPVAVIKVALLINHPQIKEKDKIGKIKIKIKVESIK